MALANPQTHFRYSSCQLCLNSIFCCSGICSIDYRITKSVLEKWVKKAREFGMDALAIDGRGRTRKNPMYQSKKKSSKPLTREEELLQENEFLRAENAFLKKLKALVEERVARENGSTRKSSNN